MSKRIVVGVDEVGRGPLAGPVITAAVVLTVQLEGLADSKRLSPRRRERLFPLIKTHGRVALGAASVREIDQLNILHASLLAMRRAVVRLALDPDLVLVDGNKSPAMPWPVQCVVGGDARVPEISAASIIAKVIRDRLMAALDRRYPGYGWAKNAGYPTVAHRRALIDVGVTRHHRRSFAPVKRALSSVS